MVEATNSDQEEDDLNVVKNMNPLLPLGSLSTDVEHAVCERAGLEDGLADSSRPQTTTENILIARQIVVHEQAVEVFDEATLRLVQ